RRSSGFLTLDEAVARDLFDQRRGLVGRQAKRLCKLVELARIRRETPHLDRPDGHGVQVGLAASLARLHPRASRSSRSFFMMHPPVRRGTARHTPVEVGRVAGPLWPHAWSSLPGGRINTHASL